MLGIGEQRMRDTEFLLPPGVRLDAVRVYPEQGNVQVLVGRVVVTERGGFDNSPGGIVSDVEPQHDLLPLEIREPHGDPRIIGESE